MSQRSFSAFFLGVLVIPILFIAGDFVYAQSEVDRLQEQIEERNDRLGEIEKEIREYEEALEEVGAEKNTLQKAINQLELERKKVLADIKYTQNKISSTDLEIDKLTLEIVTVGDDITQNELAIAEILRSINTSDDDSMIERLLGHENLSEFWNAIEDLDTVKNSMREKVRGLILLKEILEEKRGSETARRSDLIDLKSQYNYQQNILTSNRVAKSQLLKETQNEEANYQARLRDRQAARDKLIAEVRDIESQLKFILDPDSIPTPGTAVFKWPLENPRITQYFGYTKFALSGAYGGNKHNGMDLGAPIGTKIFAPLTGTVRTVGNTDLVFGCYSWGRWALIDHPNGLSSMFAHMSQIAVSPGQKVNTGDLVGYVGSTGYSTGPHLHYTLYVTDAVEVKQFNQFKSVTSCGAALSPFAAVEGYLDPLDFLPPL